MKCTDQRKLFSNNDRFDYNLINNDIICNLEIFIDEKFVILLFC